MDIKVLKVFSDLVENASFSKAAQKNQVSQSAVSQKIKSIEKKLRVDLIEKSKKSLQLTREGLIFYKYAQQMLTQYAAMLSDLQNHQVPVTGGLKILTNYWIGFYILPRFIHRYFDTFRQCPIDIRYSDYDDLKTNLQDLGADVILFELPITSIDFQSEPFLHEFFEVVGLKKTFCDRVTFPFSELQNFPLIGLNREHPLRVLFERTAEIRHPRLRYTMEFNQIELIKEAISAYNGLSILPRSTINVNEEGQMLQAIPFENESFPLTLYASYRHQHAENLHLQQFLSILNEKQN